MTSNLLLSEDFDISRSLKTMVLYSDRVNLLLPTDRNVASLLQGVVSNWTNEAIATLPPDEAAKIKSALTRIERQLQRIDSVRSDIQLATNSGVAGSLLDRFYESLVLTTAQMDGHEEAFPRLFLEHLNMLTDYLPTVLTQFPGIFLYAAYQDLSRVSDLFYLLSMVFNSQPSMQSLIGNAYAESFSRIDDTKGNASQLAIRLKDGKLPHAITMAAIVSVCLAIT